MLQRTGKQCILCLRNTTKYYESSICQHFVWSSLCSNTYIAHTQCSVFVRLQLEKNISKLILPFKYSFPELLSMLGKRKTSILSFISRKSILSRVSDMEASKHSTELQNTSHRNLALDQQA